MAETLNANARAVLEAVQGAAHHPTAAEVYRAVMGTRPNMGLASVYRILHRLVEQGYIRELRHSDESCRYDAHIARHDHGICTICGELFDVPIDIALPQEVLQAAAAATGLELVSHELRLYGRCPACRERQGTIPKSS
jgi:Fur family peroxide stress response transcriptional regulator